MEFKYKFYLLLSEEAANTNCLVFGLIRVWLGHTESTSLLTILKHSNHYTIDCVTVADFGYLAKAFEFYCSQNLKVFGFQVFRF
jgi:hypothetical protein